MCVGALVNGAISYNNWTIHVNFSYIGFNFFFFFFVLLNRIDALVNEVFCVNMFLNFFAFFLLWVVFCFLPIKSR